MNDRDSGSVKIHNRTYLQTIALMLFIVSPGLILLFVNTLSTRTLLFMSVILMILIIFIVWVARYTQNGVM